MRAAMRVRQRFIASVHRQGQPLAQAQAQAVEGEEEDPVAQDAGGCEQALCFLDGNDVGQALHLGRLDQPRHGPRLAQHVGGVELVAVQIELDRAPGVRGDEVGEVVGQLALGQPVNLVIEILAHATDASRIGVDRLGLQALEFEVLEVGLVALIEIVVDGGGHTG